ncbi:MAG: acetyl-CoA hydrolase/transferase C-terminal domain-containing protein [Sneathiella sp.]
MLKTISKERLDLASYIRPGDNLIWGQGSAEPLTLIQHLLDQRSSIGKISAFVGISLSDILHPDHSDYISFSSYGTLGTTGRLRKAGKLDLLPCHYSALPNLIESGRRPVDVAFIQLSPPGPDGTHSLGFCNDFLPVAMKKARIVIAEINSNVPWTHADHPIDPGQIDIAIETDRPVPTLPSPKLRDTDRKIADHVASVIENGATLQYGIGAIPAALLESLSGHADLGLHSGLITEGIIDLIETGVITNAKKAVYPGISVGAVAIGGNRLKDFLHANDSFLFHQSSFTHGARTLSQIDNLVGVNSALEVDVFGQINAEQIGDTYLGAIGGQVDFMHAAQTNANGLSIIALPATNKNGSSRIVSKLSGPFVTTCRSDVDIIVTEFGIADLRGLTEQDRIKSIKKIAAPNHQDNLI